jgi:putative endonuclease
MERGGSIYIMTNKLRTTLYIGVTSDLRTRIEQNRGGYHENSFTDSYNLHLCVYYENHSTIVEAIAREKQIKKWRREKKNQLIQSTNPFWKDLWEEEIQHW